jgi:hypothetical protein
MWGYGVLAYSKLYQIHVLILTGERKQERVCQEV